MAKKDENILEKKILIIKKYLLNMKFNSILYDKVKVTVLDDLSFDENDEKIKTLLKNKVLSRLSSITMLKW